MRTYISNLSPKTKKVVLAVGAALVGFLGDLSVQLSNPAINWSRAVVLGAVIGGIVRVMGAVLAMEAVVEPEAPKPSIDIMRADQTVE